MCVSDSSRCLIQLGKASRHWQKGFYTIWVPVNGPAVFLFKNNYLFYSRLCLSNTNVYFSTFSSRYCAAEGKNLHILRIFTLLYSVC